MWFDPVLHKTVLFGGIGRPRPSDRLQRYNLYTSADIQGGILPGVSTGQMIEKLERLARADRHYRS